MTEIFLPILYKFWKNQNIKITTEKCFQKPKSRINFPETNKTIQQIPENLNRTDNLTLKEIKRYQFSRKKTQWEIEKEKWKISTALHDFPIEEWKEISFPTFY